MTRAGARWRLPGSRERVALPAGQVKSPPPDSPKSSATESGRTWERTPLQTSMFPAEVGTGVGTRRARTGSGEQVRIVELGLVSENVAVRIRGDGEVALADVLADRCPGDAGQVRGRDPPMAQIVRGKGGLAGGSTGSCDRGAEAVGAEPLEHRPRRVRSSRATSAVTAAKRTGGTETQRARRVFATAAETRQRPRGSSTSPHVSRSSSPTRIPVASSTSNGSR